MYQKEEIEQQAKKYVETQEEEVFEALIKALIPVIDAQLGKNYSSLKEFWDDLQQEVLLRLWKNRGGLSIIRSKSFYQFFYQRIRRDLFRVVRKLKTGYIRKVNEDKKQAKYDVFNPNVVYFEDLGIDERRKIGIDDAPKNPSYTRHQRKVYGSRTRKSLTKPNRGLH